MEKVSIAGAGISGLTAAINLAREGFSVTVFEKSGNVGSRFHGDFQGLENWSTKRDILKILGDINVDVNFFHKGFNSLEIYPPSRDGVVVETTEPLFYLVRRGGGDDSLDSGLKKQAHACGVKIEFNKTSGDCRIIATGPKKVDILASGIVFETSLSDKAMLMLDDRIAPKGYAYLMVADGHATLASVTLTDFKNARDYLRKAIAEFKKIVDFDVKDKREFCGYGNFRLNESAVKDNKLCAGEAAGFQDYLAGFGMRYAFLSGYCAARSIITGEDYAMLWKKSFLNEMKTSNSNRGTYSKIGNRGYEFLVRNALGRGDKAKGKLRGIYQRPTLSSLF